MKRSVIAWALLMLFALGAAPAMAAGGAAARDTMDPAEPGMIQNESADGGGLPTITVESVSGKEPSVPAIGDDIEDDLTDLPAALAEAEAATGATEKGAAPSGNNTAPVPENQEIETYRGVSVGGQLTAHDADGDELTFELATDPMKGSVQLTAEGYFVYTPAENKRGKDYFGFRAIDSAGNVSQEGTVIIRLLRQKSKVTYSDMTGEGDEYAAIVLTENGVFTGEYVGEDYVFNPDSTVTRGEFLSMCMTAANCALLKGVSSTGFQDDSDIDSWLKPYVATALMNGYIQGQSTETGAVFNPDEPITLRESCVILNAVLGVTDVVSAAAYVGDENSQASWAQAVANLTAAGVMSGAWEDVEAVLTRSGAAELLANAIGLISARQN